jgi:hypothetical protein
VTIRNNFEGTARFEMTALSLRLPTSLHRKLAEVAAHEGISINQLINSAVAEKMSALLTEEYLETRAKRGSRRKFDAALAKVADIEPEERDRLLSDVRTAMKQVKDGHVISNRAAKAKLRKRLAR